MATQHSKAAARIMISPAVVLLLLWMIVPLALTLYFSTLRYNLLMPGDNPFVGFENYSYFFTRSGLHHRARQHARGLVGGVLVITVGGGVALALLLDQEMWGQGVVRLLCDRAVLRDAHGLGAGVEEHVHGPGQRASGLRLPGLRRAALRVAGRGAAPVDHPDRPLGSGCPSPR